MRAAPGNRIEERFAFKSKSFRQENVFQLLASRRSSPAVEFPGDCWQFVEMFTPTMESFSQFIVFCARPLKGFAGSRAEIDENIHKMFQFILVCNENCDCCVYSFTFYAIYRTQSRIRIGRRPGTFSAAEKP